MAHTITLRVVQATNVIGRYGMIPFLKVPSQAGSTSFRKNSVKEADAWCKAYDYVI